MLGAMLTPPPSDRAAFRATLVRVLGLQVITLVLLWILQSVYAG